MTSILKPTAVPLSPIGHEYPDNLCNTLPDSELVLNHERANFLAWHNDVSLQQTYPSPPVSHKTGLQELPLMESVSLPPFWDTRNDTDLTIRLISARQSERRAECRLIRSRLCHAMLEQELYSNMDKQTTQRLHKANISLGIARSVLCSSGLTPAGNTHEVDIASDSSSVLHKSDANSESDLEPSS
ncbi:hypothetical protein EDD22DRAFT_848895 [Suillus occidentalis]|nr:hypothetical protein EDD22DRAFT_848895 [Suillus occidentalis]